MSKRRIKINNYEIGGEENFVLIAGPCVIESEELTFHIAKKLKKICTEEKIPLIFKASYDKANRSSIKSYRGPGIEMGLKILNKIKAELNIPLLTDVHCREEVEKAAQIVDVIQIPAYLSRQTDLLIEAGRTGRIVNVKKGQFLAPWDMQNVIEKIESTGNKKILLTERGSTFGYNYLVSDFRSIVIMKKTGYPVIFDATHSIQIPGGLGKSSYGEREFIEPLARAAIATGADGVFFEVHPSPETALSDGPNSLELGKLRSILKVLKVLYRDLRKR
jgi:2-dehydro-3-deoxyphosphooctonate aldolase (KDO 8-P synthase)